MKVCVALVVLVIGAASALVCPPDICSRVRCAGIRDEDCNGRVDPKGGYCGCCPSCKVQVGEGESCVSTLFLLGVPPSSECADGLFCHPASGVCQKKNCAMKLQELSSNLDSSKPGLLGQSLPKCQTDGTYAAVQCKGSVCYCANKQGETLYSDKPNGVTYSAHLWEQQNMDCNCARDQDEYMKTGLIGKMFMCESNGNYKKYKCIGSVCHCADAQGNKVGTKEVNIGSLSSLQC